MLGLQVKSFMNMSSVSKVNRTLAESVSCVAISKDNYIRGMKLWNIHEMSGVSQMICSSFAKPFGSFQASVVSEKA